MNLLTDKTNQGLDRYYPPQVAATKKQANTEEVAAKVLSVQEGVNTSLEGAVKSVHDKMSAGTVAAPALKQLGEVWDVIGQAGVPMATALTDFSVKLTTDKLKGSFENVKNTAILASQGIVVKGNEVNHYAFNGDQQKGVPTKGVPTTRTIVMNGEQKNNDIKALMVKDGFGAGIDYVKANGYYSSEKFLENNEEKYSAKLAGYNPGDSSKNIPPQIAIEYTFAGDYTDDIYFTGAKKGDHKILTESFDANSNVTMGVVYNTIPVSDKGDEKYVGKYTTNSGLEIKLPSAMLGDVERVTGWTKNNDGSMTADSVEFKDGEPSAFETAQVLYKDGTRIVLGERSDLRDAIITPGSKSQSSGSGSSEPTIVDKYATILKSTESLKIEGRDYKVFDLVSNDHIDASKIQTLQFGTGRAPALVSSYVDAKQVRL